MPTVLPPLPPCHMAARLLHGTIDTGGVSSLMLSSLATSKAKDEVLEF